MRFNKTASALLVLTLLATFAQLSLMGDGVVYVELVEVVFSVNPPGSGELAWAVYRDKRDFWPPEYPISSNLRYWNQWYEIGSFMYVEARPYGCYELHELKVAPEHVVLSRPAPNKVEIGVMPTNGSITIYAEFVRLPAAQCPYIWLPWAPAYRIEKGVFAIILGAFIALFGASAATVIWKEVTKRRRIAEDKMIAEARRFVGAFKKLYQPSTQDGANVSRLVLRLMAEEPIDLKRASRSVWQMEVLARCGDVEFLKDEIIEEIYSQRSPVKKFELLEKNIPEVASLIKALLALRDMAPAHAKMWLVIERKVTGNTSPDAAIDAVLSTIEEYADLQNEAKRAFIHVVDRHPELWRLIHSTPPVIAHVVDSILSELSKPVEEAVEEVGAVEAESVEAPATHEEREAAASEELNKQLVVLAKRAGVPPRVLLDEAAKNLFPNPLKLDEELLEAAKRIADARGVDPEPVKDALKKLVAELRRAVLEEGMSVLEGLPIPSEFLKLKPDVVSLYSLGCNPFEVLEAAKRIMWSPSPEAARAEVDSTVYDGIELDERARKRVAQAILEAAQILSSEVAKEEVERAAKEVVEGVLAGRGSMSALAGEAAKRLSRDSWILLADRIAKRAEEILAEVRKPPEVIEVAVPLRKCPACGLELEVTEGGAVCKSCDRIYVYKAVKPAPERFEEVEVAVIGSICPLCGSKLEVVDRGRLCKECRKLYKIGVAEEVAWSITINAAEVREGVVKVIELENYNYFIPSRLEVRVANGEGHVHTKMRFRGVSRVEPTDVIVQQLLEDQESGKISVIVLTEGGWYGDKEFNLRRLHEVIFEVMQSTRMRARVVVLAAGETPFYNVARRLYEMLSSAGLQCEYEVRRIDEEGVVRALQQLGINPALFKHLFKAFPRLLGYVKAGAPLAEAIRQELADERGHQFIIKAVEKVHELGRELTTKEVRSIIGDPYSGRSWFKMEILRSLGLVRR